tara:strand:- start:3921 stop:4115 length:195 start_codon:yes stop_codon:yes gene_type:complete
MKVENPDAQLAIYINSLSKKELKDLMNQCQKIFENLKQADENKKKQKDDTNKKSKSICEILFDY